MNFEIKDDDKIVEYLGALVGVAVLCVLLGFITGCGSMKISGGSTHKVEGEATIVTKLVVDVELCDEFQGIDKQECIEKVLEILEGVKKPEAINGSN